jgi:hypothetical protein
MLSDLAFRHRLSSKLIRRVCNVSEVRSQKSEVRSQKSEVRLVKAEVLCSPHFPISTFNFPLSRLPPSSFCLLPSLRLNGPLPPSTPTSDLRPPTSDLCLLTSHFLLPSELWPFLLPLQPSELLVIIKERVQNSLGASGGDWLERRPARADRKASCARLAYPSPRTFVNRNELRESLRSADYATSGKTSLRILDLCSAAIGSCQPR